MRALPLAVAVLLLVAGCLTARGHEVGPEEATYELTMSSDGQATGLALIGPGGDQVLAADVGGLQIAGKRVASGPVTVTVIGDPATHDPVRMRLWVQGQPYELSVANPAAQPASQAANATGAHRILSWPTAQPEGNLSLQAGPVSLDRSGALSPAFPTRVRLAVADEGWERAWLQAGDRRISRLTSTGTTDGRMVLHASLAPGELGQAGRANLSAWVQRELAPGLLHEAQADALTVRLDGQAPAAPEPRVLAGNLTWPAVPGATGYRVQATPEAGPTVHLPVLANTSSLAALAPGAWELRAQAVDHVGNRGPWSQALTVHRQDDGERSAPPTLDVGPLTDEPLEGQVELTWPSNTSIAEVELSVQPSGQATWQPVARAQGSPLVWSTVLVPDGTYLVRLTVHSAHGTEHQTISGVSVANLAPLSAPPAIEASAPQASVPATGPPDPGTPLPAAITFILATASLVSLGAWLHRRRGRTL